VHRSVFWTIDTCSRYSGPMKLSHLAAAVGLTIGLGGCVEMKQLQETTSQFDKAVHTTATSELQLFHEVQAADCNDQFYREAFQVAGFGTPPLTLSQVDLTGGHCTHEELTDADLSIREKLLSTLTLYADTLQALSDAKGDVALSANEKKVAGDIKSLATQEKFNSIEKSGAAGLDAAVSAVVNVIIDRRVQKDVQSAAMAVQSGLTVIVRELQAENGGDAKGLASKYGSVTNEMTSILKLTCSHGGAECFLGIASAHAALGSVIVALPDVEKLNKTLDSLLKANASMAQPKGSGAGAEVSEFVDHAQEAASLFSASK
jgi:hypothetical protein